MALELADDELRGTLPTARTAEEFAGRIDEYLRNPRAFDDRLCEAMRIVREKYQWRKKVIELEDLCYQALQYKAMRRGEVKASNYTQALRPKLTRFLQYPEL